MFGLKNRVVKIILILLSCCLIGGILLFLFLPKTSHAAETSNVAVAVPSNLSVVFESDGTTSISEFTVSNQTLLPISIKKINVVEKNDWELCTPESEIPVDTKQLELKIEQVSVEPEENIVDIPVEYNTSRDVDIEVRRGAWTSDHAPEEAFQLEFEYEFGTREFILSFDPNGSGEVIEDMLVKNGKKTQLPVIFREGYELLGWEDQYGILYTDQYQMPVMDSCLKAKWREICGYAIYLESDQSLRFAKLSEPLLVGDLYDDKEVTAVYPIPADAVFKSIYDVVWYDKYMYSKTVIKKVIFEDVIQPRCTAYWFCNMEDCELFDLEKLDTSKVTDMSSMFAWAGYNAKNLELKGLSELDVSNVHYMRYMFGYMGYNVDELYINLQPWNVMSVFDMSYMFTFMAYNANYLDVGILSRWKVHNVTDMTRMFYGTGHYASFYVYLSPWDVSNVTAHEEFSTGDRSKIYPPKWEQ